jgi:hypothetical protein
MEMEQVERGLCSDCAKNPYLAVTIRSKGKGGFCFECGINKPNVILLDQLAELVESAMRVNLVDADEERDRTGSHQTYGISLDEAMFYMVGDQSTYFLDDLLERVWVANENQARNDYIVPYNEDTLLSPRIFTQPLDYFSDTWRELNHELKYRRRFFSENVRLFFDVIFDGLAELRTWTKHEDSVGIIKAVQTLDIGYKIYRARPVKPHEIEKVTAQPLLEVGPPPANLARANRMSPEGVVALYCATEISTAIAETRPAIGTTTAIIAMSVVKPLRVLNFSRLENSLEDNWQRFLDPSYDGQASQARIRFLKRLHDLISQPIVPGSESEYLITQTMAEYLAYVHKPNIDGILFKSVQHKGGTNLVLFADENTENTSAEAFPIAFVPHSLQFFCTDSVNYGNTLQPHASVPVPASIDDKAAEDDWLIEKLWTPPEP